MIKRRLSTEKRSILIWFIGIFLAGKSFLLQILHYRVKACADWNNLIRQKEPIRASEF